MTEIKGAMKAVTVQVTAMSPVSLDARGTFWILRRPLAEWIVLLVGIKTDLCDKDLKVTRDDLGALRSTEESYLGADGGDILNNLVEQECHDEENKYKQT